jgi:hypothetical protein
MAKITTSIRDLKYSKTNIGKDPNNCLCDILPQDQAYYFDQLVAWMAALSDWGQTKDNFVWDQMITRRPRQLSMGKHGPNSVLTIVSGLLTNYITAHKKYGVCRVSERQLEDFEWVSHIMHATLGQASPPVRWVQCLFTADGTQF